LQKVLEKTKRHRRGVLETISVQLADWTDRVTKEKAIYHTMNLFNYDIGRKLLIAEGWSPKTATEKIVNSMRTATESSGALVPSVLTVVQTREEPPTYFETNKYTQAFQAIVDAYGVAQYQEVNPSTRLKIKLIFFSSFDHHYLPILVCCNVW
jgi:V-type H+-transporting ATPase subunit a